jgi:DNA-binding MarR family transcriptional regulator
MAASDILPQTSCRIDLSRLQRLTGFQVRLAQLRIYEAFHEALGETDMTPARYCLLAILHDNPDSRPGQIAEALRVKPSNLASLLTQFEQDGLIQRVADPAERRAALIRLTAKGEALFEEIDPVVLRLEAQTSARLRPDEQRMLIGLLMRISGSE